MKEENARLGKPTLYFRLVEGAFLGVFHLARLSASVLPPVFLKAVFDMLGVLIFYLVPGLGRRLEEKVTENLPGLAGTTRLKAVARQACGALLRPMYDLVVFDRYGERFLRELRMEGMEHLERADAAGRGVILAGGHLGLNAIRVGVMARLGRCYTPIFLFPEESPVARYYLALAEFGQTLGCDPDEPVFWTGQDTVRRVREHLQRGKRVGIDFDITGRCVVDFFGRPAAFADGIARFALDTGAAVVPFVLRRGSGVFDNRLVFYPPVEGDDVCSIMQEVVRAGEEMIREVPEQWESWFTVREFFSKAIELTKDKEMG